MYCLLICLFLAVKVWAYGQDGGSMTLETNIGRIDGIISYYTRHERKVEILKFLGIPYGMVSEDNPFGPASRLPSFNSLYLAHVDPIVCPQVSNGVFKGDINCLNLNIYTPRNATNKSLPVMVYIHGGEFTIGDGNSKTFTPEILVENDVIIVTVNYRLGLYGFLCLPDLGYSNQGLKDINLALDWIKDTIHDFGGDENNIILFGHGAGSVAVELLMLHNNNNVFNKVILQSGQMASPMLAKNAAGYHYVAELAKRLGYNTKNLKYFVKHQLHKLGSNILMNVTRKDRFRPCFDNNFITELPNKANMNKVKVMIGTTAKEAMYLHKGEANVKDIKLNLGKAFDDIPERAVDTVKKFYHESKQDLVDFASDFLYNYPVVRAIRYYLENNATVYRYLFSYEGNRNVMKVKGNITDDGATHGDELGYLFNMDAVPYTSLDDDVVISTMCKMWTNFAKNLEPSTDLISGMMPKPWPAVDTYSEYFLNIDFHYLFPFRVYKGPYHDRMVFWDRFYEKYGRHTKGFSYGEVYVKNISLYGQYSLNDRTSALERLADSNDEVARQTGRLADVALSFFKTWLHLNQIDPIQ